MAARALAMAAWSALTASAQAVNADGGPGAGDGGLVGIDGLGAGIGAGAQLFGLILGNDAGLEEFPVAFGLGVLIFGIGLIACHVGLGLEKRGLVAGDIGHGLVIGGFEGGGGGWGGVFRFLGW